MENRYYINPKAYWRVINFIETYCKYREGELAGRHIKVHTWFKWQIRTIYGRYDRNTGRRAVREAYIEIPKKNAKSMYVSALCLYHLVSDGYYKEDGEFVPEAAPGVYCAATTVQQARIIHDVSKYMVNAEPELTKRIKPMQYSIVRKQKEGVFKVLSSDAEGQEGLNSSFNAIDELHAHKDGGALYSSLKGAGAARLQPLTIIITTAGIFDPTTIGWNRHEYAQKVMQDWTYDPSYHGVIFGADPEDDPFSEETWKKANPSYGTSVKHEYFEARAREAKNDPARLNDFKRYHLNIWVQSHSQWIEKDIYRRCDRGTDKELNRKNRCWMGLDLGATDDLTALARLYHNGKEWREVEEEGEIVKRELDVFSCEMDFFCTSNKMDAVKNNTQYITYNLWKEQNLITVAGDTDTDHHYIEKVIDEHIKNLKVRSITYDPYNAIAMMQNLDRKYKMKGPDFLNPASMTAKELSPPMKYLQSMIHNETLDHHGHPILEWMFDNVMVKLDHNQNIFPSKKEAKGKIDGVVALIMAVLGYLDDKYRNYDNNSFKIEVV